MYYVYIIRCVDQSLYTGITTNIEKRMKQHINHIGAKYTKSHQPLKLECVWQCKDRSQASKLEYHIKKLSKIRKEQIINGQLDILKNKLDISIYQKTMNITIIIVFFIGTVIL